MVSVPKIFVTNDDGIDSPGLHAAVEAVQELGDVYVFAPSGQQTAMGRALSGNRASRLEKHSMVVRGKSVTAYSGDASPAMILRHALRVATQEKPALILSGINYGENLGTSITHSGTVGAALEGASLGIPALAVSMETPTGEYLEYTQQDWSATKYFLTYFARSVLRNGLPSGVDVLKIDVPRAATAATPWRMTRVSPSDYYSERYDSPAITSRFDEAIIWKSIRENEPEDSDVYAITVDKVVSVAPLSLDLTSRERFEVIRQGLEVDKAS